VEHYAAQSKPLFELVEGEGERAEIIPLHSIPEILTSVKKLADAGCKSSGSRVWVK